MSWLREMCPVDLPAVELADMLISRGVHVEDVDQPWKGLEGVVTATVIEVKDHPDSEKLCVVRVSPGSAGERTVAAGVRNMKAGDVVPFAPPGARVPTLPEPIQARPIRGVVSEGMLCSPYELAISSDHGRILILPDGTPPGEDFKLHFGLNDEVLDIEIEPNRPDLMSVLGVAREAAAATGLPLSPPDSSVTEVDEGRAADTARVEILDHDRCPRYLARVIAGVKIGPSPMLVQARLSAAGVRPLSNVVDATNYVLLEMGHPLHAFDLDLLDRRTIVVRRAADGEEIVTLDGVERRMTKDDLLIADSSRGVAIAGIMGAALAEVGEATGSVLLESAYFERIGVLRTARRLGLQTEASVRFERGADPEAVPSAASRAARLMTEWSGGRVLAGTAEAGRQPARRHLTMRAARTSFLIGEPLTSGDVAAAFSSLHMGTEVRGDEVDVEIPGYRVDLDREVDLIEEVARVRGYDKIGSTLPSIRQAGGLQDSYARRRALRMALMRAGLRETISGTFASRSDLQMFGVDAGRQPRLVNPLNADEVYLRASLIPSLIRTLQRNVARQVRGAAIFEVGRVFGPADKGVAERESVAIAITGVLAPGLHGDPREADFFDAKGAVEVLLATMRAGRWDLGAAGGEPFHPARSAEILIQGERVGVVGELHPSLGGRFDLPGRVALAELDAGAISERAARSWAYREVPRFPPVRRDLAFLVDASLPAGDIHDAIVEAAAGSIESAVLFDVFARPPVPEGKKSLAFSIDFRAADRTLTDEEVDRSVAAVVGRLRRGFGAELRTGS